ncbi:hypothetical protein BDN67DRAFT_973460 [Paxillus ammoniavirescens]|nr:hypothetical protein BDN67DRAFT_973460 [Paxillus ammoniavirescens]
MHAEERKNELNGTGTEHECKKQNPPASPNTPPVDSTASKPPPNKVQEPTTSCIRHSGPTILLTGGDDMMGVPLVDNTKKLQEHSGSPFFWYSLGPSAISVTWVNRSVADDGAHLSHSCSKRPTPV